MTPDHFKPSPEPKYKGFKINLKELEYIDQAIDKLANEVFTEGYEVVSHAVTKCPNWGFFTLSMVGKRIDNAK